MKNENLVRINFLFDRKSDSLCDRLLHVGFVFSRLVL